MKKIYFTLSVLFFTFSSFAQLTLNTVDNLELCDENNDGYATFDLSIANDNALGNYAPDYYSVAYFETEDAAIAGAPALPLTYTNITAGQQYIYVKVWQTTNPANYGITGFYIIALAAPALNTPAPFTVCDGALPNDGIAVFDLTSTISEILGGATAGYTVNFYTNQADTAGDYIIADPTAYINTSNPQTILVYVQSEITGCTAMTQLTLNVNALPEAVITAPTHYFCEDFDGLIENPVQLSVNTPANNTVSWYRNGEDVTISNTAHQFVATVAGIYTAVVTSANASACTSNPSNAFEVLRSGPAALLDNGYTYENGTLTILTTGYGTYEYALNGEGPWQESNVFTNVAPGTYTVYVNDINGCGTLLMEIDAVLSVKNTNFSNLTYPNPVTDVLTLSADAGIKSVEVYNVLGQLSLTQNVSGSSATITMQGLQNGVYLVKVTGESGEETIKIVKQ
jgi:large repetitive protein